MNRVGLKSLLVSTVIGGCTVDSGSASYEVPPREGFETVSLALGMRCGSLDCHGASQRNMRLYGQFGLRLAPDDLPGDAATTAGEHSANYQSVTLLEPEVLATVWRERGAAPDRLTLVGKARGQQSHKGHVVFPIDGPGDRCLVSWLSGELDAPACEEVGVLPASPLAP